MQRRCGKQFLVGRYGRHYLHCLQRMHYVREALPATFAVMVGANRKDDSAVQQVGVHILICHKEE